MVESGRILEWRKAENDRKAGRYDDALAFFEARYSEKHTSDAGWRRLYCLRRLRKFEEAENLVRELKTVFPSNEMIVSESVWLIHDSKLKEAKGKSDCNEMIEAAKIMIEAGASGLAYQIAVFSSIDASRALGDWQAVLNWTELIAPDALESSPNIFNGRKMPSRRESWYYARIKALLETGDYEECRRCALKAFNEFRNKLDYSRWAALALEKLNDPNGAIQELSQIARNPRAPWYISADLARINHETGYADEAWVSACRAAIAHGEAKSKVNLFQLMGKISETLGRKQQALDHALLALAIREHESWKIPPELAVLVESLGGIEDMRTFDELEKTCRCSWRTRSIDETHRCNEGEPIRENCTGTLLSAGEKTPFAFIKSGDFPKPVFVLMKDLPENCRFDGCRLVFTAVKSFDRKHGRESVRALSVRHADG